MPDEIIPDRSGHLDVDGQKIWWEYHGKGDREAVCLLNGLAMHTKAWYGFLPQLTGEYDVILYDFLGQGESSKEDIPYFIDEFARYLALIMDENGVDKIHPMGISYGGFIALEFARLYPDRLHTVMRHILEVCNVAAALQLFVMPNKCEELLNKLGQTDPNAVFTQVRSADDPLALLTEGTAVTVGEALFPRFRELPASIAALFAEAEAAPKPKKPKTSKKKAAEPPAEIEFGDFQKVLLKVGEVKAAEKHPGADRLLVLKVDIGEAEPRQIVAGIASKFTPDELIGRKVVVVANLKPAQLRGVESQGMILAAGAKAVVDLVGVDAPVGEVVR